MKTQLLKFVTVAALCAAAFLLAGPDGGLRAAEAAAPDGASAPVVSLDFIGDLAAKHPVVTTIFVLIGALRVAFKPLCSAVHAVIEFTPTKADDSWWADAQQTWWFKTLAYALDWTASIKLVPPKP